ncbi:TonB-dependent receptor [Stenotrophomonas sp. 24(2023)]|uniref:TonB-dependent receptor plug domain-containing protein n=1 Tax=Stenotrophomonas sp. 24(2023) TaxID=3068324 RepID=UPI0027E19B85|nr:TonB-dependent receptor [Stenotrophomonas sp. 24(2023)]WMJ68328.1 TonB-dependent receptor [Stenotrophomonas sp. 24(2023)]
MAACWPLLHALRWPLLCVALVAACPATARADNRPRSSTDYHIAQGPLVQALQQWARQSGHALVFDARELAGLGSAGISGTLPSMVALQRLTDGLPVTVLQTPSGTIAVRRRTPSPAPAAPAAVARVAAPPAPAVPAPADVELAPVHVTGSRLPRTSVQTTLPVAVIDRDEIVRSGYGTLFDLLRHLPGMNGHPPLSTSRSGDSVYLPVGAAATTSLDGMGPRATLFLVNGRRLPRYPMLSLELGGLTDLGGIPLSFVDRIELVRGGASAIYGADAMSGVVNIILRDQADGPEAMLQSGVSSQGDGQQYRLQVATGGLRDGGDRWFAGLDMHRAAHVAGDRRAWHGDSERYPMGLVTRDGYYLLPARLCPAPLELDSEGCWLDASRSRSLQPEATTLAAYARYRHDRGQGRYVYLEARGSQNRQRFELGPTAAAIAVPGYSSLVFNQAFPEGGQIRPRVRASEADITIGLGRDQHGRSWEAGLSRQRSEVSLATDGTLRTQTLQDATQRGFMPGFSTVAADTASDLFARIENRGRTDQWQAWWGVQRDLFTLPGGAAQLASGVDLRRETWTSQPDPLLGEGELALGLPQGYRHMTRTASAAYGELGMPLASTLRLDLAGRLDHDNGTRAFSPRVGLRWTPSEQWSFLLASGRGYRAPSLFEQRRPPGYFQQVWVNPQGLPPCAQPTRRGCLVGVDVVENPELQPERSRSHSLAASWSPTPALSLSLTHNIVELRNEILALQPADASWAPDTWVRNDTGRLQRLRLYFDNIGQTVSRNWVLRGEYTLDTRSTGQWRFSLDALKQQTLERRRDHGDTVDLRGHGAPTRAAVLAAQWQNDHWDIALRGNYTGRTRAWEAGTTCRPDQHEQQRCMNPDQVRWNLHLARQLGRRVTAALDVHNLLDAQPVNYQADSGGQLAGLDDPLGRYFLLTLQFR